MSDYLDQLEAEAIYILREVAGQFDRPALLFSGGKDSICLVHLALKAFRPGKFPFPLVHVDTGHNFQEALDFRDNLVKELGENLIVRNVGDTIQQKKLQDAKGKFPSRNALQTYTLLDVIEEFEFDACIGGARRDEEKARAKERVFLTSLEIGILNYNDLNCGAFTTVKSTKERTFGCFRSATGRNWMCGTTSNVKTLSCLRFTSRTNANVY